MALQARYAHTNLVAEDWRTLARFYQELFGCTPVPPERNLSGKALEDVTSMPGAALQGVHLRLPGYGEDGPTLEIFQYNRHATRPETVPNRPGFGHIAFEVDDVAAARDAVLAAGGRAIGELVTIEVAGGGTVRLIYMADPEGNMIELQAWS